MVVVWSSVFIPTSRTSGRSGRMVGSSSRGVLSGTKLERFWTWKRSSVIQKTVESIFCQDECVTTWGWHSSTGLELQTLGFTYDKLNRLAEFHPTGLAMYGPWAVPRAVQRADSRRTWSFPVASTPSCRSCILCCSRRDWMSLGLREQTFLCLSLRHRGKFETLLARTQIWEPWDEGLSSNQSLVSEMSCLTFTTIWGSIILRIQHVPKMARRKQTHTHKIETSSFIIP